MRILHFYKTAFPDSMGGVEQVINQLALATTHLGFTNDVLSLTRAPLAPAAVLGGYQSHRARLDFEIASTGFSLEAFRRFSELASRADLVHYHYPWPFMDLVHFVTRMRKPSIVTYHSDIIRQRHLLALYRPLQRRFLADVGRIVATSANYLATSNVLQTLSAKVDVIPIGLDKTNYPTPDPARLRYWRDIVGDKFFLFVGVFRYYKGLHILLDAAKGVDFPIVMIGTGPIEASLKAQAARLALGNIRFLGHLPDADKVALLTLCHGVVFPSHLRSEAFGISLLEGAMFGKPMISSEIGTGTTFINIDGETGLVVRAGDPNALRDAMSRLWNDPGMAATMGARAEARHRALFTGRQMAESYAALYRRIVPA